MPLCSLRFPALLALSVLAACSGSTGPSPLEAALPVAPGQRWDAAQSALQQLDPAVQVVQRIGTRSATARAAVTLAGHRFDEVMIAGRADHPAVRSVMLTGRPDPAACPRVKDDLLRALGPDWTPAAADLGATTVTRGGAAGRSVRIVCNGGELSVSIAG